MTANIRFLCCQPRSGRKGRGVLMCRRWDWEVRKAGSRLCGGHKKDSRNFRDEIPLSTSILPPFCIPLPSQRVSCQLSEALLRVNPSQDYKVYAFPKNPGTTEYCPDNSIWSLHAYFRVPLTHCPGLLDSRMPLRFK